MKTLLDSLLIKFTEWFASSACVYQTFVVVMAWYAVEILDPSLDPHSFVLLALLTIYSAITQPALALVGKRSSDDSEVVLERIAQFEETILLEVEQIKATIAELTRK